MVRTGPQSDSQADLDHPALAEVQKLVLKEFTLGCIINSHKHETELYCEENWCSWFISTFKICFQKPEEGDQDGAVRKEIVPARLVSSESSGNGFTLLGETEPGHMENLSHRLKVETSRQISSVDCLWISRQKLVMAGKIWMTNRRTEMSVET